MTKYRILIVDDNYQYLSSMRAYFHEQEQTQQVEVATNGREALEKLRNGRFDAMILGLIIPQLDGIGVLEKLKLAGDPSPAVIVVSAIRNDQMIQQACALGARYFMVKPVEPEVLYRRMLDMLKEQHTPYAGMLAQAVQPPRSMEEEAEA